MHYVIGDVHGCYTDMMALLDRIEEQDPEARIIFVGDLIDRGPEVDLVLDWCLRNLTPDGKYQSVRGNHEQMVLDWYPEFEEWWNEGGKDELTLDSWFGTHYGFHLWMEKRGRLSPEGMKPYLDLMRSLPFHKLIKVTSRWGKDVSFRVVHAYYDSGDVSEEVQHRANLWMRMDCGNLGSDEILVHGHTPTCLRDYIRNDFKNTKPGMISYRHNDINVDGGCVFVKRVDYYPNLLCAIRLEDLEEFYAWDIKERFRRVAKNPEEEKWLLENAKSFCENYEQVICPAKTEILTKMGAE